MFIPIYNQQSISTCTPSTAAIKGDNNNSKVDIIATRISKRLQSQVYAYSRLCVCMCVHMYAFCIVSRCTQCIDRDICQQIPAASQHDFVQILATIVTITQRLTTHCTNWRMSALHCQRDLELACVCEFKHVDANVCLCVHFSTIRNDCLNGVVAWVFRLLWQRLRWVGCWCVRRGWIGVTATHTYKHLCVCSLVVPLNMSISRSICIYLFL